MIPLLPALLGGPAFALPTLPPAIAIEPSETEARLFWGSVEGGLGVLMGLGVFGRLIGPYASVELGFGIPPFDPPPALGFSAHAWLYPGGHGPFFGAGAGPWSHTTTVVSAYQGRSTTTVSVEYASFAEAGWRFVLGDRAPYVPVTAAVVVPLAVAGPPLVGHLSAGIQF